MNVKSNRIGIYAGTFDPVHAGHLTFALQAREAARLDLVYFMPEREPRRKVGVEHYGHRYAMLQRAVRPHARLAVLDTTDKYFNVTRTLPRLQQLFPGAEIVLLLGSDIAQFLPQWQHIDTLTQNVSFCIGLRKGAERKSIEQVFAQLGLSPDRLTLIESFAADVTSSSIRDALRSRRTVRGLLTSVYKYTQKEWLYL
jgi:nicotinate-nucleotide adenylyltransferase